MRVFGTLKSAQLELLNADPASAAQTGRLYFHTSALKGRLSNGTIWKDLAFSGGTATNDNHLVLAKAGTVALTALTREQGSILYDTDTNSVKYDDGSNLVELATANGQFSLNDGTSGAPSLKFTSDTDLGLYRVGANQLGFAASQVAVSSSGTVGAPSYSFAGDLDTGIYNSGTNTLAFSNNGVRTGFFNTSGINLISGSAAAPSYTFDGDGNTGMYRAGADDIGFATAGVQRVSIGTALRTLDGTAAIPGFSFISDTNTGMYSGGADTIGFATGGTARVFIQGNQILAAASGTAAAPFYTFNGDGDTGMYRAAANTIGFGAAGTAIAQLDSAGLAVGSLNAADRINWKVFTGSLGASAQATLTAPSGVVLGAVGIGQFNGNAGQFYPMDGSSSLAAAEKVDWDGGVSPAADEIKIRNFDNSSTNTYKVIMFYG